MKASILYIYKYIDKKIWLVIGYFSLFMESITPIIAVLLQKDIINDVLVEGRYGEFNKLIILYAIFFFGPKLWFTVRKVTFFNISYHLQMNMTRVFLQKVYNVPIEVVNEQHSGKLLNNIRNDIVDICDISVNQIFSEFVKIVLSIVFLTISLAYVSIGMLTAVLVISVMYYMLLKKSGNKTKEYAVKVRNEKANLSITIEESVSSIREVIAFNRKNWQNNRFNKQFSNYYKALKNEYIYKIKLIMLSDPLLYGTKVIVIFFCGVNVISNSLTVGEFVVSFTLVDQLVTALGELFQSGLLGKRLSAAVDAIRTIMDIEDEKYGTKFLGKNIESITFNDVTFSHKDDTKPVIDKMSLELPIGMKIAIVGESGSGKSTITKLLLRMYKPNSGEISVNGIDINKYDKDYLDNFSVVLQQPHFLPTTIRENLVLDRYYEDEYVEQICKEMRCHEFISSMPNKYDTRVGERGVNLSGGQKQRIAISRAMLLNREVLILDEATAALDLETEYLIQGNIDRLRKDKTTIIIAHRLSTILNADLIYVLENGKIVGKGTHETLLLNNDAYQKLYNLQKDNCS